MMVMEDEEEVGNNATRGQPKGPPIKDQDLDMKAGQNITDDFRRAGVSFWSSTLVKSFFLMTKLFYSTE